MPCAVKSSFKTNRFTDLFLETNHADSHIPFWVKPFEPDRPPDGTVSDSGNILYICLKKMAEPVWIYPVVKHWFSGFMSELTSF